MSEAYKNGWLAHRKGVDNTDDNPYNNDTQSYSSDEWGRGWHARYDAVKHDGNLSLDDELEF